MDHHQRFLDGMRSIGEWTTPTSLRTQQQLHTMKTHRKVVIVGSGPCGLVALKEMLEAGHDAILFERSSSLGGVFASKTAYPGLHLTISNWMMAFSDHPDPTHLHYPTAEHYLAYLHGYAKRFHLEKYCRYDSDVVSAQLARDGIWDVEVRTKDQLQTIRTETLIVATGANGIPKDIPQSLSGFRGRIVHSADYNLHFQNEIANNQLRVLIVGGGESAADLSAEISSITKNAAVWLRRPIVLAPRYTSPGKEMSKISKNRIHELPTTTFLEASTTNRLSAMQNVYFYGMFRRLLWKARISLPTLARMCLEGTKPQWIKNDQAAVVTKNQRMCEAIDEGRLDCLVCRNIRVEDHTIAFHLPNGMIVSKEFDIVLLCTGYRPHFSWIKDGNFEHNPRKWFLHCFPPSMGTKLAFIGYARPQQGGIPACAEMLSRYLAQLLSNMIQLPHDLDVLAERDAAAERQRFSLRPEMNALVDYNAFVESVARRIGCEPRLPMSCVSVFSLNMLTMPMAMCGWIISSPGIYLAASSVWLVTAALLAVIEDGMLVKWWLFPQWSAWYRQRGPGSDPRLLAKMLRRVSVRAHVRLNLRFVLFISWGMLTFYVQRFLSFVIFFIVQILLEDVLQAWQAWVGEFRPKLFALHSPIWRFEDLFLP